MNKKNYLNSINNSQKPFIIYKTIKGFDLFTDFSKKIILNNQNIRYFLNQNHSSNKKYKSTDLYIGFFGYELLNNLIGIKYLDKRVLIFQKEFFTNQRQKLI